MSITRNDLQWPLDRLTDAEQDLGGTIMDILCELEDAPGAVFDDYTEDEDGNQVGIIYPKNGAPELDIIVELIRNAMDALLAYQRSLPIDNAAPENSPNTGHLS